MASEENESSRRGDVVMYQLPDGASALEVRLGKDSVWLTQRQMASLFGKDSDTIGVHVRNVFKEKELDRSATTEESSVVQTEAGRTVRRRVALYNLDVIISVGYRVKSKRGTQFRIWATRVLRDHVIKGYSVNQRRLAELKQAVRLVAEVAERRALSGDEGAGLLAVVKDYSYALDLLDDYDHQRVTTGEVSPGPVVPVTHEEALRIVERLRVELRAGDLFGREEDASLRSALGNVMQTFDGRELYPGRDGNTMQPIYSLMK